jgi:hypothetical protein
MGRLNCVVMAAVALVVLVTATTASASKADVNIFNEVGQPIRLHCHSGNNDLGEHELLPGGKYGWGFSPNYFKNTLYWCRFGWGSHTPILDVWKDEGVLGQRTRPCTHCEWHVRPDGFYRSEAGKTPAWVHGWN